MTNPFKSTFCTDNALVQILIDELNLLYSVEKGDLNSKYDWCGCGSKSSTAIIILIVLVVILGGVGVFFYLKKNKKGGDRRALNEEGGMSLGDYRQP